MPISILWLRMAGFLPDLNTHDKADLSWVMRRARKHLGAVQNCRILRSMHSTRQLQNDELEAAASLYDVVDAPEPWFLPGPGPGPEPEDDLARPPRFKSGLMFEPDDWLAAQGRLSGDLAVAALVQGRLAERMARAGEGVRLRLALQEVAELGWWTGARLGVERLALFVALRVGSGDDGRDLEHAAWAVRRLTGGLEPGAGGWSAGLSGFLGLTGEAVDSLAEFMTGTQALHPLTRAALLLHGWRMAGADRAAGNLEAAVLAARHGTLGTPFLPLGLAGGTALRGQGSVEARLAAFYRGAEQAGLAALLLLDRVEAWQRRADAACSDLSGKTPQALIEVFARWPMVSAPMAEAHAKASRAAVQRNLDLLAARGLVREITGQGRYRVWTAVL